MSKTTYLNLINVIPKEISTSVDFWVKRSQKNFEKVSVPCGERMQFKTDSNAGAWHVYAVVDGIKTATSSTIFSDDTFVVRISNWTDEIFSNEINSDDIELSSPDKNNQQIIQRLDEFVEDNQFEYFEEASHVLLQSSLGSTEKIEPVIESIKLLSRLPFDNIERQEELKHILVQELLQKVDNLPMESQSFLLLQTTANRFSYLSESESDWITDTLKNSQALLEQLANNSHQIIKDFNFSDLPAIGIGIDDANLQEEVEQNLNQYYQQFWLRRYQQRLQEKASQFFAKLSKELDKSEDNEDMKYKSLSNASVRLLPEDDFSGRSNKEFGIGEIIKLKLHAKSKLPSHQLSQLKWRVVDGNGYIYNNENGDAYYAAAMEEETAKLALSYVSGPHEGDCVLDVDIPTVAPIDATMQQQPNTGLRHIKNTFSVGFKGEIFLTPDNVSYANVTFREGTAVGVGKGWLSYLNGEVHPIGSAVTITGNKVNGVDTVYTGSRPGPYGVGDFNWPIPWQYRLGTGSWTTFTTANHHQTSNAAGRALIEKKGAGPFTKNAADATSDY